MSENNNQPIFITTRFNFGNCDYIELKKEIKDTEESAEKIVNWIIKTKCNLKNIPITIRKFAKYAQYLKEKIILPIVLRKRALYERLI